MRHSNRAGGCVLPTFQFWNKRVYRNKIKFEKHISTSRDQYSVRSYTGLIIYKNHPAYKMNELSDVILEKGQKFTVSTSKVNGIFNTI